MSTRVAFITGSAQGIGAAIAEAFVEAGITVVMADRSSAVSDTARRLDPQGCRVLPLITDVSDEQAFAASFAQAIERFGGVDIMVNNAAQTIMRSVWDIDAAEWDSVMATNLRGTFFGCRIAADHMRKRGKGGRIINLSSLAGQRGSTTTGAHYAASKAGILVVTKVFAQEMAPYGVTVNAVAPAAIAGPMVDSLPAATREAMQKSIPVGRFGAGLEVAAAVLYLASEQSGYVTGATLDINGGLFMR